jgi:polyisoprenyl-teichoic acid--peptidoglycan teichoic acid transferase
MVKKTKALDGFVPRRPERRVGGMVGGQKKSQPIMADSAERRKESKPKTSNSVRPAGINRRDIDESLSGIDDKGSERLQPRGRRHRIRRFFRKKWVKRVLIALVVLLVGLGIFLGIRAIIAGSNVFQGNVFDVFQTVPLKQDENGRSNILIVGTSEDDPGHQGASLTDSMMIMSIDQTKKNAYLISIPRDLYVQYGRACNSGYEGKINEYYDCVREGTGVAADRKALAKEAAFVGDIFGLEMHYGVNVNYTVMRELVKAVGGITVTIESRHPDGVLDSNFDWKCGATYAERIKNCPPRGHYIDYPNGPVKLDAEHALYLAQARGDRAPTYGFEQSNFDREKNQQKIIKALREKAVSAGVLSDFSKVNAIIDAIGNNLRSTFEFKEFRTLVSIAQETKNEDIQSISLIDGETPVMTTDSVRGISVVLPTEGLFAYGQLRSYIDQRLSSNPIVREAAPIVVLNGSGEAGIAGKESDALEAAKYTVAYAGDAPQGDYDRYTLYKLGDGNKETAKKLQERYSVKITEGAPPVTVEQNVKFVLIIGPKPPQDTSGS